MTKAKELPSVAYLKECFDYNPESGELVWRVRPLHHFPIKKVAILTNARQAGKQVVYKATNGYTRVSIGSIRYAAHRVIWKMYTGEEPIGQIDHINGVRTDNRIENLRVVEGHQENARNMKRKINNTSGNTGVYFNKDRGKWGAYINVSGVMKYLGLFTDKIDAIYARYYAEQDHGFHQNHGRV